jgi:hypothetical protein
VRGILGASVGAGVAATQSVAAQGTMYIVGDTFLASASSGLVRSRRSSADS